MSVCWKPAWCECPDCGPLTEVPPPSGGGELLDRLNAIQAEYEAGLKADGICVNPDCPAHGELVQLRIRVKQATALHVKEPRGGRMKCRTCGDVWPCQTYTVLTAALSKVKP